MICCVCVCVCVYVCQSTLRLAVCCYHLRVHVLYRLVVVCVDCCVVSLRVAAFGELRWVMIVGSYLVRVVGAFSSARVCAIAISPLNHICIVRASSHCVVLWRVSARPLSRNNYVSQHGASYLTRACEPRWPVCCLNTRACDCGLVIRYRRRIERASCLH